MFFMYFINSPPFLSDEAPSLPITKPYSRANANKKKAELDLIEQLIRL